VNDHVQIAAVVPFQVAVAEEGEALDLTGATAVTVVFRAAADPSLRFTKPGTPWIDPGGAPWVTGQVGPADFTASGRWQLQVTWSDATGPRKSTILDFTVDDNL